MLKIARNISLALLLAVATAPAAESKTPPAPYVPLPEGTELDYGSWVCEVGASGSFQQVCNGPAGDTAKFYGKFVHRGKFPQSGYGSGITELVCGGHGLNTLMIEDVILDRKARKAIQSLWPLKIGKKVEFRKNFRPIDGKARASMEVTGSKTVDIMGEQRPVYVLEGYSDNLKCTDSRDNQRSFKEVWWYAPDLGAVVHYGIEWDFPDSFNDFQYTLKKITLPAGARIASAAPAVRRAEKPKPPPAPPAPYVKLAKGTVLDYGTWNCEIDRDSGLEQSCRSPSGERAKFFGKFVPVGELPRSGYAIGITELWCHGRSGPGWNTNVAIEDVLLDRKARKAIRSLWPLKVGKKIAFRKNFRPIDGKARARIEVTGTMTADVAGKLRPVYVLKGETEDIKCPYNSPGFKEVWWYAPDLGTVVHYAIEWSEPLVVNDFQYTLQSINLPEGVPVARMMQRRKPMAKQHVAPPSARVAARPAAPLDAAPPEIAARTAIKTNSATVKIAGGAASNPKSSRLRSTGARFRCRATARSRSGAAFPPAPARLSLRRWMSGATAQTGA